MISPLLTSRLLAKVTSEAAETLTGEPGLAQCGSQETQEYTGAGRGVPGRLRPLIGGA